MDEMGEAATLLSKRFRRSLEQAQMKREWSKKKKKERAKGIHPPLPCELLYRSAIPSEGWGGADDLLLLTSQSIVG